jgi:hypothetical protein
VEIAALSLTRVSWHVCAYEQRGASERFARMVGDDRAATSVLVR